MSTKGDHLCTLTTAHWSACHILYTYHITPQVPAKPSRPGLFTCSHLFSDDGLSIIPLLEGTLKRPKGMGNFELYALLWDTWSGLFFNLSITDTWGVQCSVQFHCPPTVTSSPQRSSNGRWMFNDQVWAFVHATVTNYLGKAFIVGDCGCRPPTWMDLIIIRPPRWWPMKKVFLFRCDFSPINIPWESQDPACVIKGDYWDNKALPRSAM